MTSHYIPKFPVERRRRFGQLEQTAACGFFARVHEHSDEPTCPRCAAYLGQPAPGSVVVAKREVYHCTLCRRERRGRNTLPLNHGGGNWDRGFQHLLWYCWDCLPLGQGRYDDIRTPEELSHAH